MALPMRYSIQPAALAPSGFVGDYGRMMVDYRPRLNEIEITQEDYDLIATSLGEGRAIRLVDATGRALGEFLPSLSGGFDTATFTEATQSDIRIGFKPTQELLISSRTDATFEQVATVVIVPTISKFTATIIDGGDVSTLINSICIDLSIQNTITIFGTNFKKDSMSAKIEQSVSGVLVSNELLLPTITSGTKEMSFFKDAVMTGFTNITPVFPDYIRLYVWETNKPDRSAFIDFLFTECAE